MRVLLLTPPMTQLNTPYPATAYLMGFLRSRGVEAYQSDPANELFLRLFSRKGLEQAFLEMNPAVYPGKDYEERALATVDSAIRYLQGKDPTLAYRIIARDYFPEGPRFQELSKDRRLEEAFGCLGIQDLAKHLTSLFVDSLADLIQAGVDSRFGLSRYAEKLAASQASFEPILEALNSKPTLVERMLDDISAELMEKHQPDALGLSVPFPGNVYGAFRIARQAKLVNPDLKIVLGGGYVNTELRELEDPRVFDFVDFIAYDDGEKPFLCLIEHLQGERSKDRLFRTRIRENGEVIFKSDPTEHDISHRETGTPTYDGLPLDRYISILESLNPMHRLWSDGRWNKLTLAHGCYWKKCNFCDITLDYIGRYQLAPVDTLIERIETIIRETGQSGFHFVDEAASPAVLKGLAEKIIERGLAITWWGNIRFEKAFTPEFVELLARSGCIAVSGGLEVASDRLLKKMQKGVTVEQVAKVTQSFSQAGILVHAYLMYGFPSQSEQETIDSLERVRQLFEAGCIHSAFWHRFSATAHSPIGRNPEKFGIRILPEPASRFPRFAKNDLAFEDLEGCDPTPLGMGLSRALYNYIQGAGIDLDVRFWFDKKVPKPKVPKRLIARALKGGGEVNEPKNAV